MTYDEWKQTNPADTELGSELVQCDCCAKRVLRERIVRCWYAGIETFACDVCRGDRMEERS